MNDLLIVVPFHASDAPLAERLVDWIYELENRRQHGHCLLVSAHNVHDEMRLKMKLAAEVAFESSDLVVLGKESRTPTEGTNNLFQETAKFVSQHYRWSWLWLEPDCVPLRTGWREQLLLAYNAQPRRFMGPHLRFSQKTGDKLTLGRIAVYPTDAVTDLAPYCGSIIPFNQIAGDVIVPRSTKSRLIQETRWQPGAEVRSDAVLLHSDKSGLLIQQFRESAMANHVIEAEPEETVSAVPDTPAVPTAPRRGRPRKHPLPVAA